MATADTNRWLDEECARAYWDQHWAPAYQELAQDTARWLDPQPGEHWLDLGSGGGQLTALLWERSRGQLARIVAQDCNPVNREALGKLARKLVPAPRPKQLSFVVGDFSAGLPQFDTASFDGIVSGLAVCYAESKDPVTGEYSEDAYNRLLAEMWRVLRPGGRLVFSVNVPRPRWWQFFWKSVGLAFKVRKPGRLLVNAIRMHRHASWLQREALRGRFHFLRAEDIVCRLERTGFEGIKARLSFGGQAYLFAARKTAGVLALAA
jgi:ubiquinone/menaquinone biosynthesis C-methylase UbiE